MNTVATNIVDLSPIIDLIVKILLAVLGAYLAKNGARLLDEFQTRTNIHLTDQQRTVALGMVQTVKGQVETLLDQGALHVSNVHINDPTIRQLVTAGLARIPDAVAYLNLTPDAVAAMVVGAVDTSPASPPATVTVNVPANPTPGEHTP